MKKRSLKKSNKVYSSASASSKRPARTADSSKSGNRSDQTDRSIPRGSHSSEDENRYRSRTTEGRDYGYDVDADESTYREEDALASKRHPQTTQRRRSSARRETP